LLERLERFETERLVRLLHFCLLQARTIFKPDGAGQALPPRVA
jgi:hypothetical protein